MATSFDLQRHHQAILNRIIIGTLIGSAHLWDPKMFAIMSDFFFFFFFFHWHYSPRWALACRTRSFHFSYLSPTLSIIVKSIQLFPLFDFRNNKFFTVWGC
jgi:hypothetical protein